MTGEMRAQPDPVSARRWGVAAVVVMAVRRQVRAGLRAGNCAVLEPSKRSMVRRRAGIWDAAFIPLTQDCHRAWCVVF